MQGILLQQCAHFAGIKMIEERIPRAGAPDHEVDGSWATIDFIQAVMHIRLREGKRMFKSWIR